VNARVPASANTEGDHPAWATGLQGWLLCAAIPCTAVVYSFRLVSFLHAKELLFTGFILSMAFLALCGGRTGWSAQRWLAPLWLFVLLSLLRPLILTVRAPSDVVIEVSRWTLALVGAGMALELAAVATWRRRMRDSLMLSALLVCAMGLLQLSGWLPRLFPSFEGYTQRVYSVFGNQDFFGGYLAICLPLWACRLFERTGSTVPSRLRQAILWPTAGIVLLGLIVSGCRSAWLAGTLGLFLAAFLTRASMRQVGVALSMALLTAGVSLGLVPDLTVERMSKTLGDADEGFHARTALWRSAARMAQDAPIVGVGVGNYAYWSPRYLGEVVREYPESPGFDLERHADHPHSDPLRILAETGLTGLACFAWMMWRLAKRRGPEWGGLAAWLVFATMNGPLQSLPHILAGCILMALLSGGAANPAVPHWGARVAAVLMALALAVVEMGAVVIPSYRLRSAEDMQLAGLPCLELYRRCVEYPWPNAMAHRGYGLALAEAGLDARAHAELLTALNGLDTGDIYLALGMVSFRRGLGVEARQWARECLARWPNNKDALALLEPSGHAR